MKKILYTFILSLLAIFSYAQVQLYGLTTYGGTDNLGTIFHYNPATGVTTIDQSFIYLASGASPLYTDLTNGGNNKFYGMTRFGGSTGNGVIFEWDPATNIYIKKIDFDGPNGRYPYGSLVLQNGKFYGMTYNGGSADKGVIFEWNPATNIYTKKIDFTGTNGAYPKGNLTYSGDKFYGMTSDGGVYGAAYDAGVIFEWDPVTNIYTKKIDLDPVTGINPLGSLTIKNNKFYGMTSSGGANNYGVIFEWDLATNTYSKKIDFDLPIGAVPNGSLTEDAGKFYAMTYRGGTGDAGVVFEWDPTTNIYTRKIDLVYANGGNPTGSLLFNAGKFYGITASGGSSAKGVIFEWDPNTNIYIKKRDFGGLSGESPGGSLVIMNGSFYGMTTATSANTNGVIFKWDLATNTYTKKIDFNETNGKNPVASLTKSSSKLYGTTISGGANNEGTIFEFDPATNTTTKKIDFKFIERGLSPKSSLTLNNGKFYGITGGGGAYGNSYQSGVIFEWDPATNIYTKKVDLNTNTGWASDGDNSLTYFAGKFYGVTELGGPGTRGVIYKWDPATNIYTVKFSFNGGTDGGLPAGSLILKDNKFYGTTTQGGAIGDGVIFEWDPSTNIYIKKIDFDNRTIGAYLSGPLTLNGTKFYGLTSGGGINGRGVIFEWDPATNIYTKKIDFDIANGSPNGTLLLSGAKLYGTTYNGGADNTGIIFEWDPVSNIFTKKGDLPGNADQNQVSACSLIEFSLSPLPLSLLDFKGQIQNTSVQLNWQTTNEINTSHFIVQRSANGTTFNNIGSVEARNTSGTHDYSFTDASPVDGANFYRLQMVDIDGKTTYSSIVKIVFGSKNELRVFPNPAKNTITVSGLENKGTIKIISVDGKLVKQIVVAANTSKIDVSSLTKGFYILQYNDGGKMQQVKFVKE